MVAIAVYGLVMIMIGSHGGLSMAVELLVVSGTKKSWIWIWNTSCDGLGRVTIVASHDSFNPHSIAVPGQH